LTGEALGEVFDAWTVMELAGPRSYPRGVGYHREGRVELEAGSDVRLRARVRGTLPYVVELWADAGRPGWSCSCPAAEDGSFCKHCVAVALSLGPDASVVSLLGAAPGPPPVSETDHDLKGFVEALPPDRLVEIVLDQAASDWRLRERLLAEARAGRGDGLDLGVWRRRIDDAFAPYGDFVDWREAEGWARGIDEVIDALGDLCDAGHPAAVTVLAEHAHRRADEAIQYVDDSDGWLTDISTRLAEVHLRACMAAAPDPVELASRLVELELTSELDGFHRAAATYAAVLGETGLAAYRDLLEPRWRRIDTHSDDWSDDTFEIRQAMVGWALGTGDPDALIEVHSRDQMLPDTFLEIAETLAAAGRLGEAIEWARRGLVENADRHRQTLPVREFLAGMLRESGDAQSAVGLFWDAFAAAPSLQTYRRLLDEAGSEGDWSGRCVETLRAGLAAPDTDQDPRRRTISRDAAALVEILLYEGRSDEAWDAATEFGCDQRMWLTLARSRQDTHPVDAIGVYGPEALALIDQKKTPAYRSAVDLMDRIRQLAETAGEPDHFTTLLERVRTEHRAKRNLKKLLDDRGW
jgi:uncharacterized Zn finger protein